MSASVLTLYSAVSFRVSSEVKGTVFGSNETMQKFVMMSPESPGGRVT